MSGPRRHQTGRLARRAPQLMHKNVVAYSLPSKKSYSGPPVVFRWWLFCFELTSTEVLPCHRDAGCDVIHLISRLFRLVAVVSALLPDIGPLKQIGRASGRERGCQYG